MNPETTLSEQNIKNICAAYSITYENSRRITDGFTNEAHLINGNIILKICTRPDNIDGFTIEAKMLKSDAHFKKPKFIADDFSKQVISRPYILMRHVAGQSLGSVWHTLDDTARENLIEDIAANLRIINTVDPSSIFDIQEKWGDKLLAGLDDATRVLVETGHLDESRANELQTRLSSYKDQLNNSELKTVFWDIHFDNFIVSNGELQAIIDLEAVDVCPVDYPLVVIENVIDSPVRYLGLENEQYANDKDYAKILGWYRQYYPEMFVVDQLESRLAIYHIMDALHLLKNWPDSEWVHGELATYTARLAR